ncbi:hypothetical protein BJP36_41040 [Moorena producens JHB]|uniref:Uncharacterized protein n=1 Tax=Moorena producens (strain JHB) TaxID=1454205 RepID=A0A9Q9SSB8_MOOP1|nr:hypothetical protein [Moorena producens]WAN68753.1 hypothetical protein BJP36_41040 [Moorena producens JHB]
MVDSCKVGPAILADGTGGNGSTEPSVDCAIAGRAVVSRKRDRAIAMTAATFQIRFQIID